jgi:G:T-mismatch repair DNA endonuclease (very short patch repair protein)
LPPQGSALSTSPSRSPRNASFSFPRFKAVLFVNGRFWHQHPYCCRAKRPASNSKYWDKELDRNISREKENLAELARIGWRVLVIWEYELSNLNALVATLDELVNNYHEKFWSGYTEATQTNGSSIG